MNDIGQLLERGFLGGIVAAVALIGFAGCLYLVYRLIKSLQPNEVKQEEQRVLSQHNEISPKLQGSVLRGILGSIAGMFVCILVMLLCSLCQIESFSIMLQLFTGMVIGWCYWLSLQAVWNMRI